MSPSHTKEEAMHENESSREQRRKPDVELTSLQHSMKCLLCNYILLGTAILSYNVTRDGRMTLFYLLRL